MKKTKMDFKNYSVACLNKSCHRIGLNHAQKLLPNLIITKMLKQSKPNKTILFLKINYKKIVKKLKKLKKIYKSK